MRHALVLLTIAILAGNASGQLISPDRNPPLNHVPVKIASDVPLRLQGNASLSFGDLHLFYDNGSRGAEFGRHDGGRLMLFFPHFAYWTPAARRDRTQPVAVLTHRNGEQILVEIKPDSALNQRIVDLIDADIKTGNYAPEKLATLKRIRDSVRERIPLKEIADGMDSKTGERKLDGDSFD